MTVDSNHETDLFSVVINNDTTLFSSDSPFHTDKCDLYADIRHPTLASFYQQMLNNISNPPINLYNSILSSWLSIEDFLFS